jgi:hypothetical protein
MIQEHACEGRDKDENNCRAEERQRTAFAPRPVQKGPAWFFSSQPELCAVAKRPNSCQLRQELSGRRSIAARKFTSNGAARLDDGPRHRETGHHWPPALSAKHRGSQVPPICDRPIVADWPVDSRAFFRFTLAAPFPKSVHDQMCVTLGIDSREPRLRDFGRDEPGKRFAIREELVDVTGLEPATPCLQSRCSPN